MIVSDEAPSRPTRILCEHSVSHLPPLQCSAAADALNERLLQKFLETRVIPDADRRMRLVQHVQRRKVNALCANDFVEARRCQELFQDLSSAIAGVNITSHFQQRVDAIEAKLADAVDRVEEFATETERLVRDEMARHEDRRRQLEAGLEKELDEFETKWNDETFLLRFAKPSTRLLELQGIVRSLVLQKDLERAETFRLQVAQLEKHESHNAQERAEAEMHKAHVALQQKQDGERLAFKTLCETEMRVLVSQRELGLAPLVARQAVMEAEADAARRVKFETLPPLTQVKAANPTDEATMTPRTVQRYAAFKTNVQHPKVVVRPLGVIVKKRRRTPEEDEA
jgi:siroheme synthase (precorrin-2 oxidase/ferrochelatase)